MATIQIKRQDIDMTMASETPMQKTESRAAPSATPKKNNWARMFGLREMCVYYALILLIFVLTMITTYTGQDNYLSILNMTNVIYQASLISISAAVLVGNADAVGFWPAVALAMAVAMGIGLLNGSIVQFLGINAFIVTLGTMTAVRGLILIYTDGLSLSVKDPEVIATMKAFEGGKFDVFWLLVAAGVACLALGIGSILKSRAAQKQLRPAAVGTIIGGAALLAFATASGGELVLRTPVVYMGIFTTLVWFVLTFTMVGRRLYAVGGNPEAARLSGINVLRYKLMAFVLCSGAAGFAGVLFASRLRSINPAGLTGAELTVIAAAILGGTSLFGGAGSVIKTLAGALLLYSLTNGFNILNLGANWQGLIEGIVVVVAAAIYTVGNQGQAKGH